MTIINIKDYKITKLEEEIKALEKEYRRVSELGLYREAMAVRAEIKNKAIAVTNLYDSEE